MKPSLSRAPDGAPERRFARVTREIRIRGDTIRLGQLLKLAGLIGSGSEAKDLLAMEQVRVNGEPEGRRGRQLHAGDVVRVGKEELVVRAS
jgi:ribosome-associated protein